MKTLLIVDDEPAVLEALRLLFEGKYRVLTAPTATGALASLRQHAADVAILDLSLPDMDGLILLPRLREEDIEVIVLTGRDSARDGVQAMKLGALDYIVKPYDTPTLVETVRKAADLHDKNRQIQFLRSSAERDRTFIAESESLRRVLQEIARVATTDATVLITGESGTGKEMVAHLIHRTSPRATGPFVTINCGAIPESLIESELFGHERGAFTGARERKTGKFEMAHGGTIFLDEISVLPPESQTRLLRVLQERTIARVGGTQDIPVDIRVISATNLSLQNLVREGRFREDLFYRLHVCPVNLPPLRERREDIPPLLHHFLNLFGRQFHRP
ncbi:MAG: sigma-54 dependent transcriptional regulator, partial [Planctomycetota bacterium]